VMQDSTPLSSKFEEKSSQVFMQPPWKVTVVRGIDCLACQDEFFVNITLDVKENNEYVLDFALHLSHLFRSREIWTSSNNCLITVRVSVTLSSIFEKNVMHNCCRIRREITSGQIHDSK
jgi:hypothetical protein